MWIETPAAAREPQVKAAGNSDSPQIELVLMARRGSPTGVGEHSMGEEGSTRNLGELDISPATAVPRSEAPRSNAGWMPSSLSGS